MGYVIPIAMVVMAAVGTGLSIAGNMSANKIAQRQAEQALRSNDAQIKVAENTGILQAQQQSSDRTRRYNDILSSQTALFAARGVQLSSGTVTNIADQSTEAYGRDINTIEMNRMNRLASLALTGANVEYESAYAVGAAHTRMVTGITNSLLSFGSTAISAGSMAFGGPKGGSGAQVNSGSYPAVTPNSFGSGQITSGVSPVMIR